jgi:hypothetical protein
MGIEYIALALPILSNHGGTHAAITPLKHSRLPCDEGN